MTFLLILACTIIGVLALRQFIKRWPWLFYALAVVCDVLLFALSAVPLPRLFTTAMAMLMGRGGLGVALFIMVMFIGVFSRKGHISKWLRPIRAELSIMACLLIAGHMCVYLSTYVPIFLAGGSPKNHILGAFIVAIVLLALIVLLGVTSLRLLKRHMHARQWKRLQRLAYPFYALVYVHLMLMLAPSALMGGQPALTNVISYTALFNIYLIARIWRTVVDKRERIDLAKTIMDQGFME